MQPSFAVDNLVHIALIGGCEMNQIDPTGNGSILLIQSIPAHFVLTGFKRSVEQQLDRFPGEV